MKRSRAVQLALMSSVPLLVTACDGSDERVAYQDVQQCIQDGRVSKDICEQEYQAALEARGRQAHFYSMDDCAQYGYRCTPYVTSSGDHWFVPALTGFMIGSLMGHRDRDYDYDYGSYYHGGGGGWSGSVYSPRPGRHSWQGWGSRPGMGSPSYAPTTAQTLSRGGFGFSGAARSSWGG